jgi:RNA polymerase sigma-70 factor (ECF subfamily)
LILLIPTHPTADAGKRLHQFDHHHILGLLVAELPFEAESKRRAVRNVQRGAIQLIGQDRGIREKRLTTLSAFESYDDDNEEAVDPSRFQQTGEWAGYWAFPPQPWDDQTPEKLIASQQAVNAMQRAIEALPATLKEVLILRDVEGVDAKEVCALLKITETNLYVRLHRARERVRVAVETALG